MEGYNQVIQEQPAEEVVEKVNNQANCGQWEYYFPHKAVIGKNTENTKLRIVYDASKRKNRSLSPNNCLETGTTLKPSMEHPD